jgi:hypothetical protein
MIYRLDSVCNPGVTDCAPNADRDHAFILQTALSLKF